MSLSISNLTTAVRLQGWWKAKTANLLAILYSVALIPALPFTLSVLLLAAALITIIGIFDPATVSDKASFNPWSQVWEYAICW